MILLAVAAGGFLGAAARFGLSRALLRAAATAPFPWATLAANVSGSFLLGVVLPPFLYDGATTPLRAFVTVGALGAFTTFSTFAHEAVMLAQQGRVQRAVTYVAASLLLGLAAIVAGLQVGGLLVPG